MRYLCVCQRESGCSLKRSGVAYITQSSHFYSATLVPGDPPLLRHLSPIIMKIEWDSVRSRLLLTPGGLD
jgi:hypothetical protein